MIDDKCCLPCILIALGIKEKEKIFNRGCREIGGYFKCAAAGLIMNKCNANFYNNLMGSVDMSKIDPLRQVAFCFLCLALLSFALRTSRFDRFLGTG